MLDIDISEPHDVNPDLNGEISIQEVSQSIYRTKLRKAAGLDNFPAEVLRNPNCIILLHMIISKCFKDGIVPNLWNQGIINPIPKKGDPRIPLNNRGITLICVPAKVYADILNRRLSKWLEKHDKLADNQNGFRKDRSCLDHMYSLYTVINNRKMAEQSTYVCFVDARRAFDCIDRDLLWFRLYGIGIRGRILNAIKSLYVDISCSVRLNGSIMTGNFSVDNGLKQGCLASPTLFSIYLNSLIEEIDSLNCGVKVDDSMVAILAYADDITLIAITEQQLDILLSTLNDWCFKWRMSINQEKTQVIHFRPHNTPRSAHQFKCGDISLDIVSEYKYLGLYFNEFVDFHSSIKVLAKSANRALGVLLAKSKAFGGLPYRIFSRLYETMVLPVLLYGSALWGLKEYSEVNSVQNKAAKCFLGVGKFTPTAVIEGDLCLKTMKTRQFIEVTRYWCRIKNVNSHRITHKLHVWSSHRPLPRNSLTWDLKVLKKLTGLLSDDYELYTNAEEKVHKTVILSDIQKQLISSYHET